MKKIAYPGTFDPFHFGHEYIVNTLANMFDEVHILVFDNVNKNVTKCNELRHDSIKKVFKPSNIFVHSCTDSLEEELRKRTITFVGRGIRNDQDLNIELQRATMFKQISNIDTIFIPTSKDYIFISSSIIRELIYLKKDVTEFVPQQIHKFYINK